MDRLGAPVGARPPGIAREYVVTRDGQGHRIPGLADGRLGCHDGRGRSAGPGSLGWAAVECGAVVCRDATGCCFVLNTG
jgi:hypothetical protein